MDYHHCGLVIGTLIIDIQTAERMIKDGELSLEKIARYVPALSMEELKELEAEVMQLA